MCLNKITFWGLINILILALSSGVIYMTTHVTSQIPYYQIYTVHPHGAEGKFLAFAHSLTGNPKLTSFTNFICDQRFSNVHRINNLLKALVLKRFHLMFLLPRFTLTYYRYYRS